MIYRNINFWWLCDLLRILCVNLHLCLCSQFWISSSLSEVLSLNLIFNFREVDNVVGKQLWWVGYWRVNTVLVWGTKKEVVFNTQRWIATIDEVTVNSAEKKLKSVFPLVPTQISKMWLESCGDTTRFPLQPSTNRMCLGSLLQCG